MKTKLTSVLIAAMTTYGHAVELPSITAGLNLTEGNSQTMGGKVGADFDVRSEKHEFINHGAYNYARTTTENEDGSEKEATTVDNFNVETQYNYMLAEEPFVLIKNDYNEDQIADIDYRDILSVGFGYYFIKGEDANFALELGPSYTWEEVAGDTEEELGWRFAERFDSKIGTSSKIYQSAEYIPDTDFEEYLLDFVIGVETAFNKYTSMKVEFNNKYDSFPADDKEQNDLSLNVALVFKPVVE